jgi:ABC-type transport system involved in cytochrome bd biosynthesis fused ATPase/permease subunit
MSKRALSKVERAVALCLALVWITVGCTAAYFALVRSRWLIAAAALAAIVYGMAWVRVALLARLLTWKEILVPWRPER